MRKKCFLAICGILCAVIMCITVHLEQKNKDVDSVIQKMNHDAIKERMIGAEPPRLLYADHNKVVFESVDIYIYDLKKKIMLKSFDISSLLQKKYKKCKYKSRVSSDGNEIFIGFHELNGLFTAAFQYSFQADKWEEIEESEYERKDNDTFEATLIEADNELAKITSGYAIYLSESEYFYLTFQDWKVSKINIVYVNHGKKNRYKVFN